MKFLFFTLFIIFSIQSFTAETEDETPKHYLTKQFRVGNSSNYVEIFVHFPRHRTEFASRTIDILKNDLPKIHKYFSYIPQSDVHVVINKEEETANGAAGVFPRNTIYLHDFPPIGQESLNASSDWARILVIHEYIHILTLEMTTGVFDFFRNFFGSFMKWAQFTPRWFAEGMAVWGETKFTGEGRLKHPWIQSYVKTLLADNKSCQHPICFDRPWHYPGGQLPYWIGGMLFEYVEMQKPGSVACIARDYSGNLPLMMNNSFRDCTGKTLIQNFSDFKLHILSQSKIKKNWCGFDSPDFCKKIYKRYKNIDWFKGYINNSKLSAFVIEPTYEGNFSTESEGEKLVVYDKKLKKFKRYFLDRSIDKIYVVNHGSKKLDFYISVYEKEGSTLVRRYKIFDSFSMRMKSLGKRGVLSRCHYLIDHDKNATKCLTYDNSRWAINKYEYKDDEFKKEKIYNFEPLVNTNPLAVDENKLAIELDQSVNKKGKEQIISLTDLQKIKDEKSNEIKNEKKYSGLRYLTPDYLMLFLFTGGNLTSLGAVTSLNDPLDRHTVNLGAYYNFGLNTDDSPYSGNASYTYAKGDWSSSFGYYKFISQSSTVDDLVNIFETKFIQFTHSSWIKNISWDKSLMASEGSEIDLFNIRRKLKTYKLINQFGNQSNSLSSIYHLFRLTLSPMQIQNFDRDPYYGFEGNFSIELRPAEKIRLSFDTSYGKLNIDSFLDGIIYGGGASSAFTGAFFYPSYLVPFTNISGKEMTQARLTLAYNIYNPYHYTTPVPFYLKRIYLVGGSEFIKSDFLINPDSTVPANLVIADPEISSYFFGVRTNFDLLYILPMSIDWIYSLSSNEYYDGSFQITFGSFLTF